MATQYHDWISQSTVAAQVARLRLHIAEVGAQLASPDVTKDGAGIDRSTLEQHYQFLCTKLQELEAAPGNRTSGGNSLYRSS